MSLCSRPATVRIQQISENRAGKVERHTVLAHIRRGLDLIPLELKLPLIHQLLTLVPCYSRLIGGLGCAGQSGARPGGLPIRRRLATCPTRHAPRIWATLIAVS